MTGPTTLPTLAPHPWVRRLRVAAVSFALVATTFAATAGTAFAWDASAFGHADEQLLFSLTNQDRARAGLSVLVADTYLTKEAEWRAKDMGDNNYFSHQIPPANTQVFAFMQSDGYCYKSAGENIGYSTYPDETVTANIEIAFMNSPGHRANILGAWTRMGVGAYKAADGRKLYAVLFSTPCGVTAPPPTGVATAAPTPKATAKPIAPAIAKATTKPTVAAVPTATPAPTATPSATDAPTDSSTIAPSPTPATPQPAATAAAKSLGPSSPPSGPAAATDASGDPTSLRVHENTTSRGLFDSLFSSLFGGLFGR